MLRRYGIILLAAGVTSAASARQPPPAAWQATTERLERAVLNDDAAGLREARADLLRMLTNGPSPDRAPLVHYGIAYADWRLATSPSIPQKERNDLLDEAERLLTKAVELDARFAEGFALLSGVYRQKIANAPIKGFLMGSRARSAIDRAVHLEPDNPRVLINLGVSKFKTPRTFGGDPGEAESALRRAIDRLSQPAGSKPFPAWGRFDAHAWLGQVLARRGDKAGARLEYSRALQAAPKSRWVRYVLLPALDK